MLSAVALIVFASPSQPPLPPLRRLTTVKLFEQSYQPAMASDGKSFFSASFNQCVAYDLATMKKLWVAKPSKDDSMERLTVVGNTLFAITRARAGSAKLIALSSRSGKLLWTAPCGSSSPLA